MYILYILLGRYLYLLLEIILTIDNYILYYITNLRTDKEIKYKVDTKATP